MDTFVDISILSTLVGCGIVVTLITQLIKKFIPDNIDTKWAALVASVLVGICRIIFNGQFDFAGIVAGIINTFIILANSIGIYEIGKSIKGE